VAATVRSFLSIVVVRSDARVGGQERDEAGVVVAGAAHAAAAHERHRPGGAQVAAGVGLSAVPMVLRVNRACRG